jgi:hypothetical protein
MIIYKCRFTGDEMCSDAFKPGPVKDDEGNIVEGLMQIQSQKVNKVRASPAVPPRQGVFVRVASASLNCTIPPCVA